ncbi:MAG: GWxTD domain-containing protein [Gracilimonas sp.]|uniref:GWxTD domain-containing protein n=1 Tax=Gracilimonas sp. TaxID=1974203 RepID=UPI0019BAE007|nr:GWxTD domain-containing protein [Gracilimonas sp.]MBD3616385.1 GWxTD domain-containing protein [Gracilimonas sp.]
MATRYYLILLLVLPIAIPACSNSYINKTERGDDFDYKPGFPELRIASTAYIDTTNKAHILVSGDIVYGSLIFSKKDDSLEADFSVIITVTEERNSQDLYIKESFRDTLRADTENVIYSQDVSKFERDYQIAAGNYTVEVLLIDNSSQKQITKTVTISVPDADNTDSAITNVSLLVKNSSIKNSGFTQATTYHIPSKFDSLKFQFQVINNSSQSAFNFQMRLLKFLSDTSIARPLNFRNYTPSSLPYVGIDYDKYNILESSVRSFGQQGNVIIEYNFQELPKGNYRLEVQSEDNPSGEIYKAIDFSIKSPNYPAVKTAHELAAPLYYIMDESEYDELMKMDDPQEMKNTIDRFWLSNIKNSITAKNVISLYYQRVEEANKLFSNFKAGWKTDPGIVYILFGPPLQMDSFPDEMTWYYSYNRYDPEKRFHFELSKIRSKYYPFYNYLLERSGDLFNPQLNQIRKWRSGAILQD